MSTITAAAPDPRRTRSVVPVRIRELGPTDGAVVDTVFAGLSPRSRYLRFHSPVPRLTGDVRAALTDVDGHRHVAFAAFAACDRPVGIVRIIARPGEPPELAVEVVDAWQGRGIGAQLLTVARRHATRRGHPVLVAEVLAENAAVLALLRRAFPVHTAVRLGCEITLRLTVPPASRATRTAGGQEVFR